MTTPTDRERNRTETVPLPVGIDTIRVRGPVAEDALSRLPLQRQRLDVHEETGEARLTPTSSEDITHDGLPYRIDVWRGRSELVFEASVGRVLRGNNSKPGSLQEVGALLARLHAEVGQQVGWKCNVEDLELMRLDLVRTFLADPHQLRPLMTALFDVPAGRSTTLAWKDNQARGVQTLERVTSRWRTRLYDRAGYYADRALHARGDQRSEFEALATKEYGRLRFEVELKARALRHAQLSTVGALTVLGIEQVARQYFTRSNFGQRVGGDGARFQEAAVVCQRDGRYKEFGALSGHLALVAAGLPPSGSPVTLRKYRRLAEELGLTAADVAQDGLEPMRLDWETGRLASGSEATTPPPSVGSTCVSTVSAPSHSRARERGCDLESDHEQEDIAAHPLWALSSAWRGADDDGWSSRAPRPTLERTA